MTAEMTAADVLREENEARVLRVMSEGGYWSFRALSARTAIDFADVRVIVRGLAARSLAKFARGLWTEDGEMYGSGYALTEAGQTVALALAKSPGDLP